MNSPTSSELRYASPAGRWALLATVLGSCVVAIDSTVVNVALPRIGRDFHVGLTGLQWTVNAYTLTLAGLLLLGGSLGDRYGRRTIFVVGIAWFVSASMLCAAAPNADFLIAARALQGIGGALLTPASLAIIESTFHPDDRGAAIGAWSGLTGAGYAIGPFLGGWLVEATSWRWVFLVNAPLAPVVIWLALRHVPETMDSAADRSLDLKGAVAAAAGLAGVVYALTEGAHRGWGSPAVATIGLAGLLALGSFVAIEARVRNPMLPLGLFRSRTLVAVNGVTFVLYAAMGGVTFLVPVVLQEAVGFSPISAGAALVPITVVMLLLSARGGRLAQRIGPTVPMAAGAIVVGLGFALLTRIAVDSSYASAVLPAMLVVGLGLALAVAPLTAVALGAAGDGHAGIASAINNDVSRVGGLIAVGALPVVAGLTGGATSDPVRFVAGFHRGALICAGLCAAAGALAALTIRRPAPAPKPAVAPPVFQCGLDAAPLRAEAACPDRVTQPMIAASVSSDGAK